MNQNLQVIIPYNRRNEGELLGYDANFAQPVYWNISIVMTAPIKNTRR